MRVASASTSTPTEVSTPSSTGIHSQSIRRAMSGAVARHAITAPTRAPRENTIESHAAGFPERRSGMTRLRSRKARPGASQAQSARKPETAMSRALSLQQVQVVRHRGAADPEDQDDQGQDRKSTRLNSSHSSISY